MGHFICIVNFSWDRRKSRAERVGVLTVVWKKFDDFLREKSNGIWFKSGSQSGGILIWLMRAFFIRNRSKVTVRTQRGSRGDRVEVEFDQKIWGSGCFQDAVVESDDVVCPENIRDDDWRKFESFTKGTSAKEAVEFLWITNLDEITPVLWLQRRASGKSGSR